MTDTIWRYRCVAAPRKARRSRAHKTCEDALLGAIEAVLAEQAAEGWEYLRTDLVPMEAKKGMLSATVETHLGVMVFRRAATGDESPGPAALRLGPSRP